MNRRPAEAILPALLSEAFVAFVIEADNEAERVMAHRTTSSGASGDRRAVWLTSLAMWFNCLRGLADAGDMTVAQLRRHARMGTNLDGMRRWGYVTIDGVARVRRPTKRPQARAGSLLALTRRGHMAEAIWRPLPAAIEQRWSERFGAEAVDRLRGALVAVARQFESPLPDFMPIGSVSGCVGRDVPPRDERERDTDGSLPLVSLLARVLMQFTLDYERGSPLPLAAWSNLVRALHADAAVAVAELPRITGVSREALAMMCGRLERAGCVIVEPLSAGPRGKQVRLTRDRGTRAAAAARRQVDTTSRDWDARYGTAVVAAVTDALAPIVGDGTRLASPLFAGIEAPPESWRAHVRPPQLLPWYPMVLHRGGYPDGS